MDKMTSLAPHKAGPQEVAAITSITSETLGFPDEASQSPGACHIKNDIEGLP